MTQESFEDNMIRSLTLLMRASESYYTDLASSLSPGLGRGALAPLLLLERVGPSRVTTLAAELGIDRSTVTRHLDELESRGLIYRIAHVEDGRAIVSHLTPKSIKALEQSRTSVSRRLRQTTAGWATDEKELFSVLLARLATKASQGDAAEGSQS